MYYRLAKYGPGATTQSCEIGRFSATYARSIDIDRSRDLGPKGLMKIKTAT